MNLRFKTSCLLLTFSLLLNGLGYAAMLNCAASCCGSTASTSQQDPAMSCHEDNEDSQAVADRQQLRDDPQNADSICSPLLNCNDLVFTALPPDAKLLQIQAQRSASLVAKDPLILPSDAVVLARTAASGPPAIVPAVALPLRS